MDDTRHEVSYSREPNLDHFGRVVDEAVSNYLAIPVSRRPPLCTFDEDDSGPSGKILNAVHVVELPESSPWTPNNLGTPLASLLVTLGNRANTPEEIFHVVDRRNQDDVADRFKDYASSSSIEQTAPIAVNHRLASRAVELGLQSDEAADETVTQVYERMMDDDTNHDRFMITLARFESSLRRTVQSEEKPLGKEQERRALRIAWALEQGGLLMDEHDANSLVGSPMILQRPEFAEILVYRLSGKNIEVNAGEEKKSISLAKKILKDLLARYEHDPTRHKSNTKIIAKAIYPDQHRPDSMSRSGLVGLANQITRSQNKHRAVDDQLPELSLDQSGVVEPAVERLLAITTDNSSSDQEYELHRHEDQLYAHLIGMLLEQRYYRKKSKD
jgi:hypothetical protein